MIGNLIVETIKQNPGRTDDFHRMTERIFSDSLSNCPPEIAKAVGECYSRVRGPSSYLGMPEWKELGTELHALNSVRGTLGYRWPFVGGHIYWSEFGGAQPVWGYIHQLYRKPGNEKKLGFPLSGEMDAVKSLFGTTGGKFQRFENSREYPEDVNTNPVRCGATIYWMPNRGEYHAYWNPNHGAYIVQGQIGIFYERLHGPAGPLGFPISIEEKCTQSPYGTNGYHQKFEGGSIHWSEQHNLSVLITSPVWELYTHMDGSGGRLGFPITPEIQMPPGSGHDSMQHFEGGDIVVAEGKAEAVNLGSPPPTWPWH